MNVTEKVYTYLREHGQPVTRLAEVKTTDEICQLVMGASFDGLTDDEKYLMCGAIRGDWGIKPQEQEDREVRLDSWGQYFEGNHCLVVNIFPHPVATLNGRYKVPVTKEIALVCKTQGNLWPAKDCRVKRLGITLYQLAERAGIIEVASGACT